MTKTPVQQLFEEMKEKGFFIAEYIKRPALEREEEYAKRKFLQGYEQGKFEANRDEFYEKELKRYNAGAREWPTKQEEEKKEDRDFMYKWIREKSGK